MKKLKIFLSSRQYVLPKKTYESLAQILKIVSENNAYLVNLFIVGEKKSQQLNFRYRKINKPTDVLAFPFYHFYKEEINFGESDWQDLGDIFLCYPVVVKQAREKKRSFEQEIFFLFLHGLLHLLGYDHEKTKEKKTMFSLQDKILNKQLKVNLLWW